MGLGQHRVKLYGKLQSSSGPEIRLHAHSRAGLAQPDHQFLMQAQNLQEQEQPHMQERDNALALVTKCEGEACSIIMPGCTTQ